MISPKCFLTDPVTEMPEVRATTARQERNHTCRGQTALLAQLNMFSMIMRGGWWMEYYHFTLEVKDSADTFVASSSFERFEPLDVYILLFNICNCFPFSISDPKDRV